MGKGQVRDRTGRDGTGSSTINKYHIYLWMQLCAFQIILEDYPAALGPNYETEAVCLECLSRVDGSYLCSKCNLPLCGEQCTNGPMHLPECQASR